MPFRSISDWFILLLFVGVTAMFLSRVATVDDQPGRTLTAGVAATK